MKKTGPVLAMALCWVLVLGVAGCDSETTTTVDVSETTVAAQTTSTAETVLTGNEVSLLIRAKERCYLSVRDESEHGQEFHEGVLEAGDEVSFTSSDSYWLEIGPPEAIRLFVNDVECALEAEDWEEEGALFVITGTSVERVDHEPTPDVVLKKVLFMPSNQEILQGGTYDLTASTDLTFPGLTFLVTVENQGNMDEQTVPVTVTLSSASAAQQENTSQIIEMKAGTTLEVQMMGFTPTTYGEQATLTVTVGWVPEEESIGDHSLTATLIFKP